MLSSHKASAAWQVRDGPAGCRQGGGDAAGGNHIHQRVPVADLVEMNVTERHAVDCGLGFCEMAEDCDGFRSRAAREGGILDPRDHAEKASVRVISVSLLGGAGEAEAQTAEAAA